MKSKQPRYGKISRIFALIATSVILTNFRLLAADGHPPNVLIILADDMGIECLSSYGGTSHATPNLDKFAGQGMRFTRCFSNPYCSPSRGELLTGRYPFKNGLKQVLFDEKAHANTFLGIDQPSFARQLKQAGYATAIAGKWHLSFLHQHNTINDFGFDQYQCWQVFDDNKERTSRFQDPHFNQNGKVLGDGTKGRFGPDMNVEFLIDFMKSSVARGEPFLAYHTSLLPHFPWVPTPDSADQSYKLPGGNNKGNRKYFPDMVTYFDKNVGQLLSALDELKISDNTVVFFLADNGTDSDLKNQWGDGKTIAGGKGTMTDRGTHVPLIVRWPKHIEAKTTCDDLIDFSDLLPTLCEVSGAPLPKESIHGKSFLPQLLAKAATPRDWVHVQDKEMRYVRDRDFMLTRQNELRPVVEIWENQPAPVQGEGNEEEQAARKKLQAVLDQLGD